jgi:hypothetical protein
MLLNIEFSTHVHLAAERTARGIDCILSAMFPRLCGFSLRELTNSSKSVGRSEGLQALKTRARGPISCGPPRRSSWRELGCDFGDSVLGYFSASQAFQRTRGFRETETWNRYSASWFA